MRETIATLFVNLVMTVVVCLLGLVLITFFASAILSVKNSNGWVYQGNHGTAIKEIIKEENGCVYFVDVWGKSGNICGSYQITHY